jgi:hypothetical protein
MPIRIVLADDHVLVRQGLRSLLEREGLIVTSRRWPQGGATGASTPARRGHPGWSAMLPFVLPYEHLCIVASQVLL